MMGQRNVVFVVDDESVISSTLGLILTGCGYDARSFTDPVDALRSAHKTAPDLLLTDVVMPHLNGIELAIKVQELHPTCKVLLSSGQAVTADLLSAAAKQGHRFEILPKPVHPLDLLDKVANMLAQLSVTDDRH